MIAGLPIYAVSPPLPTGGRGPSAPIVASALAGSLLREAPGLVVAPAGVACVEDEISALEEAEALRTAARTANAALVFGVDVGPPRPSSFRLFACFGGAPVLWPAVAEDGCPGALERRVLRFGRARVLLLATVEALDPAAPRRIERAGGADLIVVLSHGGATARWAPALERLERVAPLLVAAHHRGVGRAYATPSLGVRWLVLGNEAEAVPRAA